VQAGLSVKVAMSEAAQRFVAPLTFQVLSGHPVASDLWGEGQGEAMDHIEYARWADLAVVAPATANTLAKAAHGIADDIVTTLLLAYPGPLLLAPAMNDNMWRHPATQANLALLRERGAAVVGPGAGDLACGTVDVGRMAEPEEIVAAVRRLLAAAPARDERSEKDERDEDGTAAPTAGRTTPQPTVDPPWRGRRVVVTAGPTHEPIDPVRYLANRSGGTLGYALAAAAAAAGAEVTLVSGPAAELPPRGLAELVRVETAAEMAAAVATALDAGADWLIMAAAVADFTPREPAAGKIKKEQQGESWSLALTRTPDILGSVVPQHRAEGTRVVGFALETADRPEDLIAAAQAKLASKQVDFVVANDPTGAAGTFGPGRHRIHLVGPQGEIWTSERLPKPVLAAELILQLERAARDAAS
jgi:phosphopantothenoylcysteine decarboxylase/phosphopantothenate--cysteine ligase